MINSVLWVDLKEQMISGSKDKDIQKVEKGDPSARRGLSK